MTPWNWLHPLSCIKSTMCWHNQLSNLSPVCNIVLKTPIVICYALTSAAPLRTSPCELDPRGILKTRAWKSRVSTPPEDRSMTKSCLIAINARKHSVKQKYSKTFDNCFETVCRPLAVMPRNVTLSIYVLTTTLSGQMITSFWRHDIWFATILTANFVMEYVRVKPHGS